ncbi:MAG: hypothetical protein ACK47M_00180 [Caldilinea sp.]
MKKSVDSIKPWRRSTAWWVLLSEGLIAVGLGLSILFQPTQAQGWVLLFLAIVLAAHGLLVLLSFLVGRRQGNFPLIRGAVALIIGMAGILMPMFGFGDRLTIAWMLAVGLLVTGAMALLAPFIETSEDERRSGFLMAVFLLVLGGLLFYNVVAGADVLQILAWTLLIFGVALVGYGVVVRNRASNGGS